MIKTYYINDRDTIWKTIYSDLLSETINKNNEIIYKTIYKEKYGSGLAKHYINGKLNNIVVFENNKMVNGCVEKGVENQTFLRKYKNIKVCIDSINLIVEIEFKNKRIKEEYIINKDFDIFWPFEINPSIVYRLIYSSNNAIINYYDVESNIKLASFDKNKYKGIKISQNGNEYEVERYLDDEIKSYIFGFEEMVKKLKEWSKDSSDNR